MSKPYDPLELENLGLSIVGRLNELDATPISDVNRFEGSGIYAIYYAGDFPAYQELVEHNADELRWPIYVGKADPEGGRKGGADVDPLDPPRKTFKLSSRIIDHRKSLISAENLDVKHFAVRWLRVADIWTALGESALIHQYRPLWNRALDGFGNHDPGAGRRKGMVPQWDTVHPGREWAAKMEKPNASTAAQLEAECRKYLRERLN